MKKKPLHKNNIKALSAERGLSSRVLAKKIGTSAPHMSRLIHGQSPLTHKWLLKLSAALKVPTSTIVGLDISKKFNDTCDDTLLGSVMGWLLEASDQDGMELSRQELTKLTSFIYKEAVERPLNFTQTRYLAEMAVKLSRLHK